MKKLLFVFLLFGIIQNSYSQTIISGKVMDKSNHPQENVSVVLREFSNKKIASYGLTNKEGIFELKYKGAESRLIIEIYSVFLEATPKEIPNKSNNEINFIGEEKENKLSEVVVKPKKAWRDNDTINFSVRSLMSESDISIGETLKRIPGITVSETGQISYQGLPISKFYIEDMDLLKGRYGIATNNISPHDVETAQVLEEHQPIKSLKGLEFKDNAAINLKLKDKSKGILMLLAKLGAGEEGGKFIFDNEMIETFFARKQQNISMFKMNNRGVDIFRELQSFSSNSSSRAQQVLNVKIPSPPHIKKEKYYFNNSKALSFNHLKKTKAGDNLSCNIIYLNDFERRNGFRKSAYVNSSDELVSISEKMNSMTRTNKATGDFVFNRNKENSYLNNMLQLEMAKNKISGIVDNEQAINNQHLKLSSFAASNNLHFIKRKSELDGIEFLSKTSLGMNTQNLAVSPNRFKGIFNQEEDNQTINQALNFNSFETNGRLNNYTRFRFAGISLTPSLFYGIRHQSINSELMALTYDGNHLSPKDVTGYKNNARWTDINAGATILMTWSRKNIRVNLYTPIVLKYLSLENKMNKKKQPKKELYFEPRCNINLTLSDDLKLSANYSRYHSNPTLLNLYYGNILTDYRTLHSYEENISHRKTDNISMNITYSDVLNLLFLQGELFYRNSKSDILYGRHFNGIHSSTISREIKNHGEQKGFKTNLSKAFDWKNTTIKLFVDYSQNSSMHLRGDNEIVPRKEKINNIKADFLITPIPRLQIDYSIAYGKRKSAVEDISFYTIKTFRHNLDLSLNVCKGLLAKVSLQNYNNNIGKGNQSFSFVDTELGYNRKNISYRLSLNNLLNTKKHIAYEANDLSRIYTEYDIHPRSILLQINFRIK